MGSVHNRVSKWWHTQHLQYGFLVQICRANQTKLWTWTGNQYAYGKPGQQFCCHSVRSIQSVHNVVHRANWVTSDWTNCPCTGMSVKILTGLHDPGFGTKVGQVHIGFPAINDRVWVLTSSVSRGPVRHSHLEKKHKSIWLYGLKVYSHYCLAANNNIPLFGWVKSEGKCSFSFIIELW